MVAINEICGLGILETAADCVWVQPLASVIVTVYVPAARFDEMAVELPLLHKYAYGIVPP